MSQRAIICGAYLFVPVGAEQKTRGARGANKNRRGICEIVKNKIKMGIIIGLYLVIAQKCTNFAF